MLDPISPTCNARPTVRLIIVGGEACSRELANRWSTPTTANTTQTSRDFFNTYGPTEATVVATIQRCVPRNREESVSAGQLKVLLRNVLS